MKHAKQIGMPLTRKELQQLSGGVVNCYLCCRTPGGYQCWPRSSNFGSATGICRTIYPAYPPSTVTGAWYC